MSGEPKTLTLEEALEKGLLAHRLSFTEGDDGGAFRLVDALSIGVPTIEKGRREIMLLAEALAEAVRALGVPVVARDDAAELRAALGAATEAIGSVLADPFYIISGPARNTLEDALRAALAAPRSAPTAPERRQQQRTRLPTPDRAPHRRTRLHRRGRGGVVSPKEMAFALDRPVVARDDAAELRAAIREWVDATDDAEAFEFDQTNAYGTDHADAEDRVEAAVKTLRALAATEGRGEP